MTECVANEMGIQRSKDDRKEKWFSNHLRIHLSTDSYAWYVVICCNKVFVSFGVHLQSYAL